MTETIASRSFQSKPDFDQCMERIYAWYDQRIVDRPPVRFHHHNIEYEKHRTEKVPRSQQGTDGMNNTKCRGI